MDNDYYTRKDTPNETMLQAIFTGLMVLVIVFIPLVFILV